MRRTLESAGFLVLIAGIAGVVNHVHPPWRLFNLVNGVVLPRLGLSGYQLYLDLLLVVVGLVLMLAASATRPEPS